MKSNFRTTRTLPGTSPLTKNNNNPTKHVDFYAKLKIRAARATKRVRKKREEHFVKETILDEAMEEALGDPYNDVIEEINENIQNQVKDQISSRVNSQVDKHMNESISSKRERVVRQLRIVVGYIQVLSNLDLTFDVPWPKDFQTYFRSFAFINFDMQIIFGTVDVCNLTVVDHCLGPKSVPAGNMFSFSRRIRTRPPKF